MVLLFIIVAQTKRYADLKLSSLLAELKNKSNSDMPYVCNLSLPVVVTQAGILFIGWTFIRLHKFFFDFLLIMFP